MPKLKNPPIREAFIRFDYRPGEHHTLDEATGKSFFEDLKDYKAVDVTLDRNMQVRLDESGKHNVDVSPPKVTRMRGKATDDTRWVVLGTSNFSMNFVRKNLADAYPGFRVLLDGALKGHSSYQRVFRPKTIYQAHLVYIDVFAIPLKDDTDLSQFLTLRAEMPEALTPVSEFMIGMSKPLADDKGTIRVVLERIPNEDATPEIRLKMDWHGRTALKDSATIEVITSSLTHLHDEIWSCFRACFTEDGWSIFGGEQ